VEVVNLKKIKSVLDIPVAIDLIEAGFVALSNGAATVPPVGYLGFADPPADCHIKFGHIHGDEVFVIKIATGFYDNASRGLPIGNGLIVVLSAETGEPILLLHDSGYLTNVRTAIAGCIAARYLAPKNVNCIGIIGAGTQARMQLEYLRYATDCKKVKVWSRPAEQMPDYQQDMSEYGFDVEVADSAEDLCASSRLIVTTTPATAAVIRSEWILPGTHITAMGCDSPGKQELDPKLFAIADVCAVDSMPQCVDHGDTHYAIAEKLVSEADLTELGDIISGKAKGRSGADEITIADLTGVAVQDIQIAKAIWQSIK